MMRTHLALVLTGALWMQLPGCADDPPPSPAHTSALRDLAGSDPAAVAEAFVLASRRLNDGTPEEERAALVAALEKAITANPVALVGTLETTFGGVSAVRRYAEAMMAIERSEGLGRQIAALVRGGAPGASPIEALSRSEPRDGSVWYPLADDAGFFVGCVAWALERSARPSVTAAGMAAGLGVPRSENAGETESWSGWLRSASIGAAPGARLPEPAARVFNGAFRRAFDSGAG